MSSDNEFFPYIIDTNRLLKALDIDPVEARNGLEKRLNLSRQEVEFLLDHVELLERMGNAAARVGIKREDMFTTCIKPWLDSQPLTDEAFANLPPEAHPLLKAAELQSPQGRFELLAKMMEWAYPKKPGPDEAVMQLWPIFIGTTAYPESFFKELMKDFNNPDDKFANWLANSGEAAKDIEEVTGCKPEQVARWTGMQAHIGTWNKISSIEGLNFPLKKEGQAYGLKVEVRESDASLGGKYEVATPHTTRRKAIMRYIRQVRSYFSGSDSPGDETYPGLIPNYYWGAHLNLSLTPKQAGTVDRPATTEQHQKVLEFHNQIEEIAYHLLLPNNPFDRNVYIEAHPMTAQGEWAVGKTGYVRVKHTDSLDKFARLEHRCKDRPFEKRLELKMCSIWARTDENYLLNCGKAIIYLIEHPELAPAFLEKIKALYAQDERLLKPGSFSGYEKKQESEELAAADNYHAASKLFIERAKPLLHELLGQEHGASQHYEMPTEGTPDNTPAYRKHWLVSQESMRNHS